MIKILVIGSVPPPHLGQAIMTSHLINIKNDRFKIFHIDLSFSKKANQIGKFNFSKILSLLRVFFQIIYFRIFHNCTFIYYCPSGHRKAAIIRDILILWWSRRIFKKTIFHFHAYGVNIVYGKLNYFLKFFFKLSFYEPDIMIKLTEDINKDEVLIQPKQLVIIPNGIQDSFSFFNFSRNETLSSKFQLLYVGAIYEERGVDDLISLMIKLKKKCYDEFELVFVGEFINQSYKDSIMRKIFIHNLDNIQFKGELIGKDKFLEFNKCNLLVFPSKVPSETFGLVIVEAMQFYKPSLVTNRNGPRFVVQDQYDSILYEPGNIREMVDKVLLLKNNNELYLKICEQARETYLKKYTLKHFESKVSSLFEDLNKN